MPEELGYKPHLEVVLDDLLRAVRGLIRAELRTNSDFSNIIRNNELNLDAIVTDDGIMTSNLSRQRTRLSVAEALIVDSFLPSNL